MNSKPKKILLLGASFTTRNMGVCALASGAITAALHAYPDAQIYFLDYQTKPASYEIKHTGGTRFVQLINLRFSKKIWLSNNIARLLLTAFLIRMLPFRSLRNRLISRNLWLHHIQMADIVGSIAGGDSFSDIYGLGRLIYVALPQIFVLLLGKQLVLLPQTIGPFKGMIAKTISQYILKRTSVVYSRDHDGLGIIHDVLSRENKRIKYCYDMGFAMESHIRAERIPSWLTEQDNDVPLIGINVSGLLYIGGYTKKNMFGLKVDYRQLVHDLIGYFCRKHNARVMLVPHTFGGGENSENDGTACRRIYSEIEDGFRAHLHLLEEDYDQHELKALIGRCYFFLGSRMHACIAALSQYVPAAGLAYSQKFYGVFKSIGMEDLVIDLRKHDRKTVIDLVDRLCQRHSEFRTQLKTKMPDVRESILNLFTGLPIEAEKKSRP